MRMSRASSEEGVRMSAERNNRDVASEELEYWLSVVAGGESQPSDDFIVIAFPTDAVRDEYLRDISSRAESEVRQVLARMLGHSRSLPEWDALQLRLLNSMRTAGMAPSGAVEDSLGARPQFSQYHRRAILAAAGESSEPTWPGLTWVLDLLPGSPDRALAVVSAYLLAHAQVLPDLRITGLSDATAIIRSRYILGETDAHQHVLSTIDWRDFEFLVAALYEAKDYEVEVTPEQKDGGRDVIARRTGADAETLYIACSQGTSKKNAGDVAALNGRLDTGEGASRGVFVNIASFTERGPGTATKVAKEMPRINLLGGEEFQLQMNEHLGADWPYRVDGIVTAMRRSQNASDTTISANFSGA